jgi:hypothetical protein
MAPGLAIVASPFTVDVDPLAREPNPANGQVS